MSKRTPLSIAEHIMNSNIYLSLGTCSDKKPWVSPVCYFLDPEYNFYYGSQMHSVHTLNILKNPQVSWAVFDSHQKEGTGNGVQCDGTAQLLGKDELKDVIGYCLRSADGLSIVDFVESAPYRMFRLTPENIYVLDPEAKVDKRVEVKKSELTKRVGMFMGNSLPLR